MKKVFFIVNFYLFFIGNFIVVLAKNNNYFLVDLFDLEKNSVNVKKTHKNLDDLFKYIKKDFEIKEKVGFKFYTGKQLFNEDGIAVYIDSNSTIYLDKKYFINFLKKQKKSFFYPFFIFLLRHELEHHRQTWKYKNSYHGNNRVLQEKGADTVAAKACFCCCCLEMNQIVAKRSSKQGYWTAKEFDKRIAQVSKKFNVPICKGCLTESNRWQDFL